MSNNEKIQLLRDEKTVIEYMLNDPQLFGAKERALKRALNYIDLEMSNIDASASLPFDLRILIGLGVCH